MSQTLNEQQRKLVEDNHNLIYSFMNSRHLSTDDIEDWYGVVAIALCKAAMTYDDSRDIKFATYAYRCMQNAVSHQKRHNANQIVPAFSLDDTVDGVGSTIGEIVADRQDPFFDVYVKDALEAATKHMDDRNKRIVDMVIRQGYDQSAVAKHYGISRQRVSEIIKPVLEKLREYFND